MNDKKKTEQDRNETIDRSIESNCRAYFIRYPAYAEEVFGHIPSKREIDKFFEDNSDMYIKIQEDKRRRL